jgi:CelD/BcsL family acetyltransferase involved in cellulose biosynthesis
MKATAIRAHELTPLQIETWASIQQDRTDLDSPFLSPDFTQAAAQARAVEVMLIEDGGEVRGFLPFQRDRWGAASPVAAGLSEWQAVILGEEHEGECDIRKLLRSSGLKNWHFDHLIESQASVQNCEAIFGAAPCIDLSGGFDLYAQSRRDAGSACITETLRKRRKLEREIGPIRFELHTDDRSAFETLLKWKAAQNERTGLLNIFRYGWVVDTLESIWRTQSERFAGVLSALHVGDDLVAVHLGPRSSTISHLWFTAYDPKFAKYSPGLILLIEMARGLADNGVTRIDLGPGPQRYKLQFKTGDIGVARGVVDQSPTVRAFRRGWNGLRDGVRSGPLAGIAKIPAHLLFRLRQWNAFRYAK